MTPRLPSLVLAPLEATSSFIRGSASGPEGVLAELDAIEAYDPDVGLEGAELHRLERFRVPVLGSPAEAVAGTRDAVASLLDRGRFPLTLGGEHTVTLGPLAAVLGRWDDVGLVQLDAHGDLRNAYEGRELSHACVMRRASELGVPIVGLGIRSVSPEEVELLRTARVRHLGPRDVQSRAAVALALEDIPDQVYLTVDMDVFDPSVAPGVGTPEIGGLDWPTVAAVIDQVCSSKQVVGADIVELAPGVEHHRTVRLAARVAVRVLLRSCAAPLPQTRPEASSAHPSVT